jgi:hypothetical protein
MAVGWHRGDTCREMEGLITFIWAWRHEISAVCRLAFGDYDGGSFSKNTCGIITLVAIMEAVVARGKCICWKDYMQGRLKKENTYFFGIAIFSSGK